MDNEGKVLHKMVSRAFNDNTRTGRDDDWIHASDIPEFCNRRFCLSQIHGNYRPKKKVGAGMALTFAIGRSIADAIIENLLLSYSDHVLGRFRCPVCGSNYNGFKREPEEACETCGCKIEQVYDEILLQHSFSGFLLSGSVDLFMGIADVFYPVEIKSIRPEDYDKLTEPSITHEMQLKTYLWLLKHKKVQKSVGEYTFSYKKGYVLYACKAHKQNPFKIFPVTLDKVFDTRMRTTVKELKTFSDTGELPKRICKQTTSLMARSCLMCEHCFGVEG